MPVGGGLEEAQSNHDNLQSQLAKSQRNATSMILAQELTQLQGSMATDLAKLKQKRESIKASREKTKADGPKGPPGKVASGSTKSPPGQAKQWEGTPSAESGKSVAERLAAISGKPAPPVGETSPKRPMAESAMRVASASPERFRSPSRSLESHHEQAMAEMRGQKAMAGEVVQDEEGEDDLPKSKAVSRRL